MKLMSIVFQKVYLFHDTIENNIKFGKPTVTHEEVVEAARRACCHEFIEKLPMDIRQLLAKVVQHYLVVKSNVFLLLEQS